MYKMHTYIHKHGWARSILLQYPGMREQTVKPDLLMLLQCLRLIFADLRPCKYFATHLQRHGQRNAEFRGMGRISGKENYGLNVQALEAWFWGELPNKTLLQMVQKGEGKGLSYYPLTFSQIYDLTFWTFNESRQFIVIEQLSTQPLLRVNEFSNETERGFGLIANGLRSDSRYFWTRLDLPILNWQMQNNANNITADKQDKISVLSPIFYVMIFLIQIKDGHSKNKMYFQECFISG